MGNYLDGIGKEFCLHCKKHRTPEGHDGCIGTLKNVMNACCGHGETKVAYVQFNHERYKEQPNKIRIDGKEALAYIEANKIVVLSLIRNEMKQKEYTGVKTRDNKKIYVGDKVDTVQGSVFTVVKLEHISGIKYALHDGKRPYDLEPFMSPNLWLVEEGSACS